MADTAVLSALEAGFLYAEDELTPMHVGSLAIYDGAGWRDAHGHIRLRALRGHIARRLEEMPRLLQRPLLPAAHLGRPRWVDDTEFDIERHVRLMHLPSPGTEVCLLSAVADLNMALLDRAHPLWELWFVDGLDDGRVALLEKIHHSLVDGIGGVDLAMMLLDPTPEPARRRRAPVGTRNRQPSRLQMMAGLPRMMVGTPVSIGLDALALATHPRRAVDAARHLASAVYSFAYDPLAPHSTLNADIGCRRNYRVVRCSLPEVRATGHALGGTVNDVVLTAVTSGLANILATRHEDLGGRAVHALVPVSVRRADEHRDLGNRVAAMIVPLPVNEPTLPGRFDAVRAATRSAKDHHQADLTVALLELPENWPEPILAATSRLVHRQPFVNLVVTNVPGPPIPLYLMGSRMLEIFPIVPLAGNLTVSIGILSYCDDLTLGFLVDPEHFADLEALLTGIEDAFAELGAMTGSTPPEPGGAHPGGASHERST